jgi:hypothetical protein
MASLAPERPSCITNGEQDTDRRIERRQSWSFTPRAAPQATVLFRWLSLFGLVGRAIEFASFAG